MELYLYPKINNCFTLFYIDLFIIVHLKNLRLNLDRIQQTYNFLSSMDPTNIIKENKVILLSIFEFVAQKNLSHLIHQAFRKNVSLGNVQV